QRSPRSTLVPYTTLFRSLGVEVELVHHHLADVGLGAVAQRHVGQDLGGAADDGGARVDAGVAGHHADVLGAEHGAQVEELLRHQDRKSTRLNSSHVKISY